MQHSLAMNNIIDISDGSEGSHLNIFDDESIEKIKSLLKDKCNLSIKVATQQPVARNNQKTLEARAQLVIEWIQEERHTVDAKLCKLEVEALYHSIKMY